MKAKELITAIEAHYPLTLQEEWDHSGLQCGDINQDITKVMIALDCDLRTLKQAIEAGCDMLVTHHPFLFNDLTLDLSKPTGQFIKLAMTHSIVIYSSHTPLDFVSMNEWLIHQLPVLDVQKVGDNEMARSGILEGPYSFDEFIKLVKEAYHVDTVKVAGYKDFISTVAVCGGSGASFIDDMASFVDAYITGDLKYHDGQKAYEQDILLVDIGHHAEVIMVDRLAEELSTLSVDIVKAESEDYYEYY